MQNGIHKVKVYPAGIRFYRETHPEKEDTADARVTIVPEKQPAKGGSDMKKISDPGFAKDVASWCRRTGNTLISNQKENSLFTAVIQKGLTALRKPKKQKINKSLVEKMFGVMLPRGVRKLKLSKMNMAGMTQNDVSVSA